MAAYGVEQPVANRSRSLKAKHERRARLRIRVPQADDVVGALPDSDSDSDSEDGAERIEDVEDGDDSDDETDIEDPERVNPPLSDLSGGQPTAPGFITLVPSPASPTRIPERPSLPTRISQPVAPPVSETAGRPISTMSPPTEEPSPTNAPSRPVAPPESIVNSSIENEPTTFVSSTITTDPVIPSESPAPPAEEDQESLISDTSLLASTTAEPTSIPTEAVEQIGASDGGTRLDRGADVGIIIGTLALASLLVAACVLLYRRRKIKKANQDHLDRLNEKVLPMTIDGGQTGGGNRPQFSSWANFVRPNGEDAGAQAAAGYFGGNEKGGRPPMSPMTPRAPPTPHGAAGAFRSLTGQEPPPQMTSRYGGGPVEGRLVPPPAHLAPPPRTDIYPPGQVPINQHRAASMARTEVTDSTEGTWRTWGVDQKAPRGPGPSRQR